MGVALVAGSVTGFTDTYDDLSSQPVVIKVDGSEISSYDQEQGVDLPAVIVNGRTMLPLKRTFELFGVNTVWNGQERSITADTPNGRLWLQIDNDVAKLNGVDVQLDAAPTIFKSRTFVPLAFISESMGVKPLWNG
ncbi:copper amine oxidase N-terminal domain-containing protein, partial [Aduncisulcus paluster]